MNSITLQYYNTHQCADRNDKSVRSSTRTVFRIHCMRTVAPRAGVYAHVSDQRVVNRELTLTDLTAVNVIKM